jgi:phenylacetic acid degradation operon negative regulatory protein
MSNTSGQKGFSKKILALLAAKPAISVSELAEATKATGAQKYALARSLKGLSEAGLVESHHSGQKDYARLTREGKKKAHSIALDSDTTLLNPNWDGKWRIVLLDLPEERKSERDGLRYLLKKAGFILLKNSVWISPYPFEHLFMNIKKDLGLTTEIMIFVTSELDKETEEEFLKLIK